MNDAIDRTQRLARRVDEARLAVPASFSGYDARVAGVRTRIGSLAVRTEDLLAAQNLELQTLARARLR